MIRSTMSSEKAIKYREVAFSCNDAGTRYLEVAVYSLLEHYKGEIPLRVNVFEGWGGHSERSKAKLKAITDSFNAALRYHNIEKYVEPYADLLIDRADSRWNIFTWTPIFTPQVLADAEGTVIHFDIDMLFNADVSELFEMEIPFIACSYEYDKYGDNAGRVIWDKGILPPSVERYFNTGVLAFNAEACRKERSWEKIIAWYREHYAIADRIEQDAWNALYHDRCTPLHVAWNFHDRNIAKYAQWNVSDKYWLGNPPKECLEASLQPKLLHFWGKKKPWKPSHRPYRKLYHAAMSAVGQLPPKEELFSFWHNFRNLQRLSNIAKKLA